MDKPSFKFSIHAAGGCLILIGLYHFLHHVAADLSGFSGLDIAVITGFERNADFVCRFHFQSVKRGARVRINDLIFSGRISSLLISILIIFCLFLWYQLNLY